GAVIAKIGRLNVDRGSTTLDWATPLELVDGEVDPLPQEDGQRPFEAALGHEPLDVSQLAANTAQERTVGTRLPPVDLPAHEAEEASVALSQPASQRVTRSRPPNRRFEQARDRAEQAEAGERGRQRPDHGLAVGLTPCCSEVPRWPREDAPG